MVLETAAWSAAHECQGLQGAGEKGPHERAEEAHGVGGLKKIRGGCELTAPETNDVQPAGASF